MSNQYQEFVNMLNEKQIDAVLDSLDNTVDEFEKAWPLAAVNGIPPWSLLSRLWRGMQELQEALRERIIDEAL